MTALEKQLDSEQTRRFKAVEEVLLETPFLKENDRESSLGMFARWWVDITTKASLLNLSLNDADLRRIIKHQENPDTRGGFSNSYSNVMTRLHDLSLAIEILSEAKKKDIFNNDDILRIGSGLGVAYSYSFLVALRDELLLKRSFDELTSTTNAEDPIKKFVSHVRFMRNTLENIP